MTVICTSRATRIDPAEYESDNPAECAECHAEFDLDDDAYTEVLGKYYCSDHTPHCEACGMLIEPDTAVEVEPRRLRFSWAIPPVGRIHDYTWSGLYCGHDCLVQHFYPDAL